MDNIEEYETDEQKKFQITRGMVILAAIVLVIIITIIIIIVNHVNSKKPEYTEADFKHLEARMEEEAPTYLSQKGIQLTSEETRIDLKYLLAENGGSIDSNKVKAAKVCKGYVVAIKVETESYKPYISCGKYYTTTGYISNNKPITSKVKTTRKDTEKPVITLIGNKEVIIKEGSNYDDEGAKAMDNIDGDVTSKIKISGTVDTKKIGAYTITYTVSDKAGNVADASRKVTVVATATTTAKTTTTKKANIGGNTPVKTTKRRVITTKRITTPPTITLRGSTYMNLNAGDRYKDPGYYATDAMGMDITSKVNVSGSVNTSVAGTYKIKYSVMDSYGNSSSKTRTVKVTSNAKKLQSISLTPNVFGLTVGESETLSVLFSPSDASNKQIIWSSSNPSVATISNGVVTGKSSGNAIITAKGSNGTSATASVTVTKK